MKKSKRNRIISALAVLALLLALPGCAKNDTEKELEEYLMEIYGPYGVCKCLGDGKYYAIDRQWAMLEDWEGDVRMTLYPIENERDIYTGDEFVCRSEKSEYLLDERPRIIMENLGDNTLIYRGMYFQVDYLYEGKWYAARINYYPYVYHFCDDDILLSGEKEEMEINENMMSEWRRVVSTELNDRGFADLMEDYVERKPGRYRFSRRAKIEETGEVITLACEYDIVEAKKE